MWKYKINANLVCAIERLYDKAISAVQNDEWQHKGMHVSGMLNEIVVVIYGVPTTSQCYGIDQTY